MANDTNTSLQRTWDDYINSKVNSYVNSGRVIGKDIWVGTDANGMKHFSTTSQKALDNVIAGYNSGAKGYTTKDGTDYTLVQTGTDPNTKQPIYTTVNTTLKGIQDSYTNSENDTRAEYTANDALYKQNLDLANNATNANYDSSAKQYYSQYMQNQKKLKEQASQLGLTGGASETARLGVVNNYSTNYANNEGQRNSELNSNQMSYNSQVASNHEKMADALASIYSSRAGEESNFYNNAQAQAYTRANMDKQAALDISTYQKEKQIDSDQAEADAQALADANEATLKSLRQKIKDGTKKGKDGKVTKPNYWIYYDKNGYLRATTSQSVAEQNGGIKYGSRTSIEELNARETAKQGYKDRNYYNYIYSK